MKIKRLLYIIFVLTWSLPAFSAVYYIDYVGGDDSGTGLNNTGEEWQYHPGDARFTGSYSADTVNGDTFIFKGGVTYVSTSSGDILITIGDSGGGAGKEMIYRGNTIAGDWGTGRAIIDGNAQRMHLIYGSGKDYLKFINLEFTNNEEIVNNPGDEGMLALWGECDYIDIEDCVFHSPENWNVMCALDSEGTPAVQRGIMLYDNSGNGASNITIDNVEFYAMPYDIRAFNASTVTVKNSRFTGATTLGGTGPTQGYMSMALLITNNSDNWIIQDNVFRDGWRYEGDESQKRCHSGDWIHIYCPVAVCPDNITIERNIFYNDKEFDYTHGSAISLQEDGISGITWRNNIFLNPHASNGVLYMKDSGTNYKVYNNLFVVYNHTENGIANGITVSSVMGTGFEIKNNIFVSYVTGSGGYLVDLNNLDPGTWDGEIEGNTYYKPDSPTRTWYANGANRNWATWNGYGYDTPKGANSSDPNLQSLPSEGNEDTCKDGDYHLTASSDDQIDNGLTLSGFSDDYDDNARPVGAAWDVGPYEYQLGSIRTMSGISMAP